MEPMELPEGAQDFLEKMLHGQVLENARKHCSLEDCKPDATFRLPPEAAVRFRETSALVEEAKRLSRQLDRLDEVIKARTTLFWDGIKERLPEYDDAYRMTLNNDLTSVLVYTRCKDCSNPKKGD